MESPKKFMDLKVPVFYNKRNNQPSVVLPKKKLKQFGVDKPKFVWVKIRRK